MQHVRKICIKLGGIEQSTNFPPADLICCRRFTIRPNIALPMYETWPRSITQRSLLRDEIAPSIASFSSSNSDESSVCGSVNSMTCALGEDSTRKKSFGMNGYFRTSRGRPSPSTVYMNIRTDDKGSLPATRINPNVFTGP